ncbi:hypothetical protein KDL01_17200 [Actinospica durhamensis]|uniref:HEAT repeat domain-containing protein n=1 Tax=Actinospica durhamensis TaxID=1508375 RepID=A0A941EPP7_9ACTN|nr:hypothetical protein [Actinospica durhamensis]MBR7835015.1 hypothetical protein [Actinospica durhamensis]
MLLGLADIDWSSMHHAYGTAEEVPELLEQLASPDADVRGKALSRFYSAVHHQGDVMNCTVATLPFLLDLAGDFATPDRPAIVALLVSIGEAAIYGYGRNYIDYDGVTPSNCDSGADLLREHAPTFIAYAADGEQRMRRAAIPALAWFIDDAPRAAGLIQARLTPEADTMERLLVLETMAVLAERLPAAVDTAVAWFDVLAADPDLGPEIRLAALAQRTRCSRDRIGPHVIPTAVALIREIADEPTTSEQWAGPPREKTPVTNAPPQIADAFAQLDHFSSVYAPTTDVLRTFHKALGARVAERTALLTAQTASRDAGTRLDAVRMACDLMKGFRGDHSALISLVAGQLDTPEFQVAAEAAAALESCQVIAEPARDALAEHVARQEAIRGPLVWAAPDPHLRRAHQNAVRALARLGDDRAVPHILAALEQDVDTWRAVGVAGCLPQAADRLTPHLCRLLGGAALSAPPFDGGTQDLLTALRRLNEPTTLPTILEFLTEAVQAEQWSVAGIALTTVAAFGSSAQDALPIVRSLTSCSDGHVRSAAVQALWAIGVGESEILPLVLEPLQGTTSFWIRDAGEILTQIDRDAACAAVPRLRELLTNNYVWTRIFAASTLWDVAGEPEAQAVLDTLEEAWVKNGYTRDFVAQVMKRMGPSATPMLPRLVEELAETRRCGGLGVGISRDEDLQRDIGDLIAQLA